MLDDTTAGYEKYNWNDNKLGGSMTITRRKKEEYWDSSALALDFTVKMQEIEYTCTFIYGTQINDTY